MVYGGGYQHKSPDEEDLYPQNALDVHFLHYQIKLSSWINERVDFTKQSAIYDLGDLCYDPLDLVGIGKLRSFDSYYQLICVWFLWK